MSTYPTFELAKSDKDQIVSVFLFAYGHRLILSILQKQGSTPPRFIIAEKFISLLKRVMWELLNELIKWRHATMDYIPFVNPDNAIKKNEAQKKQFYHNLQSTAPLPKQFLHAGFSIIPSTAVALGTKIGAA